MRRIVHFDSAARQRAKQSAREQDDRDLREGRISPEALQARNGLFSGVDFSRASMRRRRRLVA